MLCGSPGFFRCVKRHVKDYSGDRAGSHCIYTAMRGDLCAYAISRWPDLQSLALFDAVI
jgi:hypothetical protein